MEHEDRHTLFEYIKKIVSMCDQNVSMCDQNVQDLLNEVERRIDSEVERRIDGEKDNGSFVYCKNCKYLVYNAEYYQCYNKLNSFKASPRFWYGEDILEYRASATWLNRNNECSWFEEK
uniref:Uncharacterized protein n=1 Tax=viral metagenome TaxID=1070528 RepID=A0A6M3IDF9_9ZZZZ